MYHALALVEVFFFSFFVLQPVLNLEVEGSIWSWLLWYISTFLCAVYSTWFQAEIWAVGSGQWTVDSGQWRVVY